MPRKGPKMDKNDEIVFEKATKSQYSSTLYKQLKRDKKLDKFIMALQICGLRNYSISETCKFLSKVFPTYVRGKGLNTRTLANMLDFYPELGEAYGFSLDFAKFAVFENARRIAETTDDIGDIKTFNEMYDDGTFLYVRDKDDVNEQEGSNAITEVRIFNSRIKGEGDGDIKC